MTWFAASVITYARFEDGRQNKYPIKERLLLVKACGLPQARKKTRRLVRLFPGKFPYRGRRAKWVFGGIRRIVACLNPLRSMGADRSRPADGTELTSSQFLLTSRKDLEKFVAGAPVRGFYMALGSWE